MPDNETRRPPSETSTPAGEAAMGMAQLGRDYALRITEALTEASRRWASATEDLVPGAQSGPAASRVPSPAQVVDAAYDMVEQVLTMQRRLAHQLIDAAGVVRETSGARAAAIGQAASEAAAAVTESAREVSQAAMRADRPSDEPPTTNRAGGSRGGAPDRTSPARADDTPAESVREAVEATQRAATTAMEVPGTQGRTSGAPEAGSGETPAAAAPAKKSATGKKTAPRKAAPSRSSTSKSTASKSTAAKSTPAKATAKKSASGRGRST